MAKKHLKTDGQGNVVTDPKIETYKAKVKPYTESQKIRDYRLNRNRVLWKMYPESRAEIEEMTIEMKKNWKTQDKRKL